MNHLVTMHTKCCHIIIVINRAIGNDMMQLAYTIAVAAGTISVNLTADCAHSSIPSFEMQSISRRKLFLV